MLKAIDYARYIVDWYIHKNVPITNTQLQHILCYLQEQYRQETGNPLFPDHIENNPYGGYVPNVYYAFGHYGCMPITHNSCKPVLPKDMERFLYNELNDGIPA